MRNILASIRAFLMSTASVLKMVARPVYVAGKWTTHMVLEHVVEPIAGAVDTVISLPSRLLGGGGGTGPRAAEAADAAAEQVQQTQDQANRATKIQKTASALQRAAEARLVGLPGWEAKAFKALGPSLFLHVSSLDEGNLRKLASADVRDLCDVVTAISERKREAVDLSEPVVTVAGDVYARPPTPTPAPTPVVSRDQEAMLGQLAERMRRMQATSDADLVPARRFG